MFGAIDQPRILVLGLGESGLGLARWVQRFESSLGTRLRLADTREAPPQLDAIRAQLPAAEVLCGPDYASLPANLLDGVDIVGISPGLSPYHAPVQTFVAEAGARGIAVWSEIEFFAQALRSLNAERGYAPRVIGVTGTNGKSTVTSLVAHIASKSGLHAIAAGNISPAALVALGSALDSEASTQEPLPELWVLELSSFQLETTQHLPLTSAVVLNVTEDHLDWHPSLAQYGDAKARIWRQAHVRVANRNDTRTIALAGAQAISFGLDAPVNAGDFGVVIDGGMRWLARAEEATGEDLPKRKRGAPAAEAEPARVQVLMPADALPLAGDHNLANALAALALVTAAGIPMARALHGLRAFTGLPHRVEHVLTLGGVDYIDDSKGTNVGATVAALNGLKRKVVLIAGGDGKGQDFNPLLLPVAEWCRAVVLIGRDAPNIEAALQGAVPIEHAPTLEAAVKRAAALAQAGDSVLLSPACASLDMFRNYAHRAEVFVGAVRDLALDAGQPC
jgi:UDP-N-acetylmuramoylalanine--D-glutamate ligase